MADNKRTCTFAGCNKRYEAGGYCLGHYAQAWHGKPLTKLRSRDAKGMSLQDRIEAHTQKTDTCWIWTGAITRGGYGNISIGRKKRKVHRVAYELAHGPISTGMVIDHICHNRACVRPDHLRLATVKQNSENRAGATIKSKSGIRGVHWCPEKGRWAGRVGHYRKIVHVGYFETPGDAEAAVIAKRNELFSYNNTDRP